jgi:hypothetical protein
MADEASAANAQSLTGTGGSLRLEIKRALDDRVLFQREAMKIVAAAGANPSIESIANAQRLCGVLLIDANSMWGAGDRTWFESPTRILGRFVTRYALGQPDPYFPGPPTSLVPETGAP